MDDISSHFERHLVEDERKFEKIDVTLSGIQTVFASMKTDIGWLKTLVSVSVVSSLGGVAGILFQLIKK